MPGSPPCPELRRWLLLVITIIGVAVNPANAAGANETTTPVTTPSPGNDTATFNQSNSDIRLNHTGNHTYRIVIGNSSAQMIILLLNMSLFAHPLQGGKIGFSSVGRLSRTPIITVEIGLTHAGAANIGALIANPFEGFSISGRIKLQFPFSDGPTPGSETT